jgi:hypothetical protein
MKPIRIKLTGKARGDRLAALLLVEAGRFLEPAVTEYRFAPPRRWRFDVAWPGRKLAVEIEGGGFIGGRHSRGTGMEDDCEKYAEAMALGWRVLRVTPRQIENGRAFEWLRLVAS